MKRLLAASLAAIAFSAGPALADPKLVADVEKDYRTNLEPLFLHFHANPELSFMETKTAARMAEELRKLGGGLEITEKVGGTGVVAVLKNGAGPTVLIRADMDGLPLTERSGLPYASKVKQVDVDGIEQSVMHACGHDTHLTALIGTARQLIARKNLWRGTVVFVVQPAEERVGGAKAMIADGLYTRFPKPEYAIGFHVAAAVEAGMVKVSDNIVYSSADSVDIKVRGVGAHGASPHQGVDPVLVASAITVALQSLVSRSIDPLQPGVVTVGAIHGGTKHNIIPEEVDMQLTVRADTPEVRKTLLDGIKRVAEGTARAMGVPENRMPTVGIHKDESTPPTANDQATARRVKASLVKSMGANKVGDLERNGMGAEDFAYFVAPEHGVKGAFLTIGGTPKADLATAPSHHSPLFKITPEPVIKSGVEAMTLTAMELLGKK